MNRNYIKKENILSFLKKGNQRISSNSSSNDRNLLNSFL